MTRPDLSLLRGGVREVLPVAWDGRAVWWRDEPLPVRSLSHFGDRACSGCGSTTAPMDAYAGRLAPRPGATVVVERTRRTRSGRTYRVDVEVPAWPRVGLYLYRCLACGHDDVFDLETDELWELDDDDFGPDGSWPDEPPLPGMEGP